MLTEVDDCGSNSAGGLRFWLLAYSGCRRETRPTGIVEFGSRALPDQFPRGLQAPRPAARSSERPGARSIGSEDPRCVRGMRSDAEKGQGADRGRAQAQPPACHSAGVCGKRGMAHAVDAAQFSLLSAGRGVRRSEVSDVYEALDFLRVAHGSALRQHASQPHGRMRGDGRFEARRKGPSESKERWPSPLLRFATEGDLRLTGMALFALLYPSSVLAQRFDPALYASGFRKESGRLPSRDEVMQAMQRDLRPLIATLTGKHRSTPQVDERWYWAIAVLLDLQFDGEGNAPVAGAAKARRNLGR